MRKRIVALFSLLFLGSLTLAVGCNRAQAPSSGGGGSAAGKLLGPAETWDVYYLQNTRVGYAHTTQQLVKEKEKELVHVVADTELSVERYGTENKQSLRLESWETPGGELVRFLSRSNLGSVPSTTTGEVHGKELVLRTASADNDPKAHSTSFTLPWRPDIAGFFGVEQSLLRQTPKPGEKRTLSVFLPVFNQVGGIDLEARGKESVKLLDATQDLLRVDSVAHLKVGDQTVDLATTYWIDSSGDVLKSHSPALDQTTYRTTHEQAMAPASGASADLGLGATVRLAKVLDRPLETSEITYHVKLRGANPAKVFAQGATQKVEPRGDDKADITVRAITPSTPIGAFPEDSEPTPDDQQPNQWIQSDDPRIQKLASEVTAGIKDPWQQALALELAVHDRIRAKNFSTAFASAGEVIGTLEGDCTEHAVLLAALTRAAGMPSRVAIGLVYMQSQPAFGYHMWTEVYLNGRWVPIDGTMGHGGIAAEHLKLMATNLHGADAMSAFLPVATVLGRLEIEVADVKYGK